jgi:hypothetical protein
MTASASFLFRHMVVPPLNPRLFASPHLPRRVEEMLSRRRPLKAET